MAKLTEEMKEMIKTQQCFVATVSADGMPNVGPKRSTRVVDDETLMFTEGTAKQTYANVCNNGKVAVAVINKEILDGYRFVGKATVHHDGPIYEKVAKASTDAGRPAPKAVVTIAVDSIYSLKPGPTAGTKIG